MAQPITLGAGYDSFTGKALPSVLLPTEQTAESGTANVAAVEVCTSYDALCRALGLSVGYCAATQFSGGSIFPTSLAMTPTSVCVVLKKVKSTSTSFLVAPLLGLGAWAPSTATEVTAFFKQFGDSYVSAVVWGRMYVAMYVFDGQTPAGQRALAKRLRCMNGPIDSSTAEQLAKALSESGTTVTAKQWVFGATGLALPNPNDAEAAVAFALAFAETNTADKPALLSFATTGYERLGAFHRMSTQSAFAPVVTNRNTFNEQISHNALALVQVRNQVRAIQDVYARHGGFEDEVLFSRAAGITDALQLLHFWCATIERDPTTEIGDSWDAAAIDTALGWGLPALNQSISMPIRFQPALWISGGTWVPMVQPVGAAPTSATQGNGHGHGMASAMAMGSGWDWGWQYLG